MTAEAASQGPGALHPAARPSRPRWLDGMIRDAGASYLHGHPPGPGPAIHAFHALAWDPVARRCWRDAWAFLDRHMRA